MSMAPSNPRLRIEPSAVAACLLLLGALTWTPARATQTDSNQPADVKADHASLARSGVSLLTGHVTIVQGTMQARADKGTAYQNANGEVGRIVLEGKPATMQQALDGGGQMHAHAETIDYKVDSDTVILAGNAHVDQTGQGSFDGAHLVYNTKTGAIEGNGGDNGQVHLILEPRKREADAKPGNP